MSSKKISQLIDRVTITGVEAIPVSVSGLNYSINPFEIKTFITSSLLTFTDTTDSINKDTGCLILEGGLGVEKRINLGSSLGVGTNITFLKETNHTISISDSTSINQNGGNLTISAAKGASGGDGGEITISSGGVVGTGSTGPLFIQSSDGTGTQYTGNVFLITGSTVNASSGGLFLRTGDVNNGSSGTLTMSTGASNVSGNTGTLTLSTGTSIAANAGNIILAPGDGPYGTTTPTIQTTKNIVRRHDTTTIAVTSTIQGVQLVSGYIEVTGGTGSIQLPSVADITTAIGITPAGTTFDFCVNASTMTATNTVTLVVDSNMTIASAPAITGGGSLTLTQNTQVIGWWRITYITPTTCKIQRIA